MKSFDPLPASPLRNGRAVKSLGSLKILLALTCIFMTGEGRSVQVHCCLPVLWDTSIPPAVCVWQWPRESSVLLAVAKGFKLVMFTTASAHSRALTTRRASSEFDCAWVPVWCLHDSKSCNSRGLASTKAGAEKVINPFRAIFKLGLK